MAALRERMFEPRYLDSEPGPELARTLAEVDVADLDADATLSFVRATRRQQAWTESLTLEAVAHFAELRDTVDGRPIPGAQRLVQPGGAGTPRCGSFTPEELAPELRVSRHSAQRLIADALDLKYRLPSVAAAVRSGAADAYRARLVAAATRDYSLETADDVDDRVADRLHRLSRADILRTVEEVAARVEPEVLEQAADDTAATRYVSLDPSSDDHIDVFARLQAGWALRFDARINQLADMLAAVHPELGESKAQLRARAMGLLADPDAALALARRYRQLRRRPHSEPDAETAAEVAGEPAAETTSEPEPTDPLPATTLYAHYRSDGTADLERCGVLSLPGLAELLRGAHVTVKPVIDLAHLAPSAGYQPSDSLREGIILTNPTCLFPYCDFNARKCQGDHTIPYPHGPTEADNLGPPCPLHHNVKTHGDWQLKQPFRGIFVWRSPTGRIYVVDHRETVALVA